MLICNMEKITTKIPENLEKLSKEELVSLLKSIKNDIDLNKTKEIPNKTEKTPNVTEKTPNVTEATKAEATKAEATKAEATKAEATKVEATKAEANPIKTDGNLATNKKKGSKKSEKKKSANFDFCKHKKRHVALKFLYIGWDYGGFAVQKHTEKTIEEQLFLALMKTKLVEDRESSNYHRCGRTDKGVSAFSQVISLDLRSNVHEGKGVITPEDYIDIGKRENEIDYPGILNRVLPPEIKVIAWAPVEIDFSARFNCIGRTYKYWFPIGDLDIKKMLEAGKKLVGEHDFRNFCKMDVANGVTNYKRKIFSVDIKQLFLRFYSSMNDAYDIAELTVAATAFLYHEIRCIVSILYLIGLGKEDMSIIDTLLDVEGCPRKPQYAIASEIPLILFDCSYDDEPEWEYNAESLKRVIEHLQNIWSELSVKSVVIKSMLTELEELPGIEPVTSQAKFLLPGVQPKTYKRLLERPVCDSLEEQMEKVNKKQKLKMSKELTTVPL